MKINYISCTPNAANPAYNALLYTSGTAGTVRSVKIALGDHDDNMKKYINETKKLPRKEERVR